MRALFTCDLFEVINVKESISKEQFCKLYGGIKDELYRYALYRLGEPSEAEDAVSDAVLAAWKSIDKLRDADAFSAWMFAILRNTVNANIKSIVRRREKLERAGVALSLSSEAENAGSLSLELREALSILGDEERDIVLMSVIGGFTSNEISEMTDLTAGAVRSKLSRSLAKMREFLS